MGTKPPIGRVLFRRLALLLALLASALAPAGQAQTGQAGKRVALLIGNQDYKHERKLRNPVNDAELLGRVLKQDLKVDWLPVERNLDAGAPLGGPFGPGPATPEQPALPAVKVLKDRERCPEMVMIPSGTFHAEPRDHPACRSHLGFRRIVGEIAEVPLSVPAAQRMGLDRG